MVLSLSKKQENTTSKESLENKPSPAGVSGLSAEIRAGFMVVFSAIVLIALLMLSSRAHFLTPVVERKITFGYIGGLAKNAPVHFAGHNVGKVEKIHFIASPKTQIEVTISMAKDVPIRRDSEAFIDALGFMGEKYMEITTGTDASPLLGETELLKGTDPIPMMEMIKKGNAVLSEFEQTNQHMKKLTHQLDEILSSNRKGLDETFENLNSVSANLKDMTEDLKTHPWKLLRKS